VPTLRVLEKQKKHDTFHAAQYAIKPLLRPTMNAGYGLISTRAKAVLKVLKDRGVQLGNPINLGEAQRKGHATNREKATEFADKVLSLLMDFRNKDETLHTIAERMNRMGVNTRRGGKWHASTVSNILKRA
jgi:hypothetical protein